MNMSRQSVPRATCERGFIALVSALIISVVLLSIVIVSGMGSFYARMDALGKEQAAQARSLASSCVDVALLALATSTQPLAFIISGRRVNIDEPKGETCIIDTLTAGTATVSIHTHASVGSSYSSISAAASTSPRISISSWREF